MTRPVVAVEDGIGGFEAFYRDRFEEVVRALAVTLQDQALARDAAQEAFARGLKRWDEVAGFSNPSGWVYRVGLNWARSRIRRWTRDRDPAGRASGVVEEMPMPADRRLVEALRALPAGQRAVVVLRVWLDWSVAQTAEALDISTGTVKSRQHRALARLAELLEVERS